MATQTTQLVPSCKSQTGHELKDFRQFHVTVVTPLGNAYREPSRKWRSVWRQWTKLQQSMSQGYQLLLVGELKGPGINTVLIDKLSHPTN